MFIFCWLSLGYCLAEIPIQIWEAILREDYLDCQLRLHRGRRNALVGYICEEKLDETRCNLMISLVF